MATESPNLRTVYNSQQLRSPLLQSVLMIVVIVVFGWFVLQPKYATTQEQKGQLDTLEDQQATLEADREELNKLLNRLQSSDDQVKLLDEAIPLHTRSTETALLLESYARSSGLLLTQLTVEGLDKFIAAGDKETLKNPYKQNRDLVVANSEVVVSGNIEQFRNFLSLLETSGRLIDVDDLEVNTTEDGPIFRLGLKTYAFMEAEATAAEAVGGAQE